MTPQHLGFCFTRSRASGQLMALMLPASGNVRLTLDRAARRERDQFCRGLTNALGIPCGPAVLDPQVATDSPAPFLQPLQKRANASLSFRIVRGQMHEHADAPHPLALLRSRRERPGG